MLWPDSGLPKCIGTLKLSASIWSYRLGMAAYLLDIDVSESLWPRWQYRKPDNRSVQFWNRPSTVPESVSDVTALHIPNALNPEECTQLEINPVDAAFN